MSSPERKREYIRKVLFEDMLLSGMASTLSFVVVRWISEPIPNFNINLLVWLLFCCVGTLIGSLISGSYKALRKQISFSTALRITNTVLVKEVFLAVAVIVGAVKFETPLMAGVAVLADFLISEGILIYLRVVIRQLNSVTKDTVSVNATKQTVLVVGTDDNAISIGERILSKSDEYDLIGFTTDNPSQEGQILMDKAVYLCRNIDELNKLMWRFGGIDCLVFSKNSRAFSQETESPAEVSEQVSDSRYSQSVVDPITAFVKRGFDLVISLLLLVLFSPAFLIISILIKREDHGPVIYAQERVGKGGKAFRIFKFRTMHTDAEAMTGPALYTGTEDPRLTKVGRFLRVHHLDELPQLWNVLNGQMSFIGYRPEREYYIRQIMRYDRRYEYLYQIRPGVTSYATLFNGYTDTMDKMLTRLEFDLYYLRNNSLVFDLRILFLTLFSVMIGKEF